MLRDSPGNLLCSNSRAVTSITSWSTWCWAKYPTFNFLEKGRKPPNAIGILKLIIPNEESESSGDGGVLHISIHVWNTYIICSNILAVDDTFTGLQMHMCAHTHTDTHTTHAQTDRHTHLADRRTHCLATKHLYSSTWQQNQQNELHTSWSKSL